MRSAILMTSALSCVAGCATVQPQPLHSPAAVHAASNPAEGEDDCMEKAFEGSPDQAHAASISAPISRCQRLLLELRP